MVDGISVKPRREGPANGPDIAKLVSCNVRVRRGRREREESSRSSYWSAPITCSARRSSKLYIIAVKHVIWKSRRVHQIKAIPDVDRSLCTVRCAYGI